MEREAWGIAPEIFEAIDGAFILVKDMDDDVGIIGDDPLAGGVAIDGGGGDLVIDLEAFVEFGGDGFEMGLGVPGADDKEVGECGDTAEVEGDDILGFFFGSVEGAEAGELFGANRSSFDRVGVGG